jgi:Zinc finger C-x8-C-x5-C-x3-H type (and similar)
MSNLPVPFHDGFASLTPNLPMHPPGYYDPPIARTRNGGTRVLTRFKTKLCSFFMESNGAFCPHGASCQFAHGYAELRPVPPNEALLRPMHKQPLRPMPFNGYPHSQQQMNHPMMYPSSNGISAGIMPPHSMSSPVQHNNVSPIFLSQKDAHLLAIASAKAEMLGLPAPTNPSQAAYLLSIVSNSEMKAPGGNQMMMNSLGNLMAISPPDSSSAASFSSAGRNRDQSFSSAPAAADFDETGEMESELKKVQDWTGIGGETVDPMSGFASNGINYKNQTNSIGAMHKNPRHHSNASASSTVFSDTNSIQTFSGLSDSGAMLSIGSLSRSPPRSIADIFSSTN